MEQAELDVHVSGITCDGIVRLEGGSDGTGGKIDPPANKCHHP